jgi:hypothetical protein
MSAIDTPAEQVPDGFHAQVMREKLEALRNGRAPLPLPLGGQQTAQAMRLRSHGMSYTQIAKVMAVYHGAHRSPAAWQKRCRAAGAAPDYRHRTGGFTGRGAS